MRRKITMIFVSLVVVSILTSCQPTPDNPVVVNKANGELEKKIKATPQPVPEATEVPIQHINESFKGKDERVTITIDADVLLPNVDQIPVVEIEPDDFDMKTIKRVAEVLLEGKPMYEPRTGKLTKGEIEQEILELQQALADPENSRSDGLRSGDPETVKEVTKMFQQRIKNYLEQLEDAPDEYIPTEVDFEFHTVQYYEDPAMAKECDEDRQYVTSEKDKRYFDQRDNTTKIVLDATLDDGYGRLIVENYSGATLHTSHLYFNKAPELNHRFMPVIDLRNPKECTLTQEEAEAKMDDLLHRLGIEDMQLTKLYPDERRYDREGNELKPPVCYGYFARYERTYGDIVTKNNLECYNSGDQYAPWYAYEVVEIHIWGNDIVAFSWTNPTKVVETVNGNVAIMPLEDIIERFKSHIALEYNMDKLGHYAPENNNYQEFMDKLSHGEVNIKAIELCMVRIAIPNEPNRYRMIPAWKFYGEEGVAFKGDDTLYDQLGSSGDYHHYLTINAIDGSIINQQGY